MVDGRGSFLPESKRSFPDPLTSFYKLVGLSRLFPNSKTFSRYSLAQFNKDKNHEVDVLSGAFMMGKRDVLLQLRGFDEDFFMYGEDIDLSYRIQKLGYKNYYLGENTIIHFKGESTKRQSLKYLKVFYGAMIIFVKKHYLQKRLDLMVKIITLAIWMRAGLAAAVQTALRARLAVSRRVGFVQKKDNRTEKLWRTLIVGTEEEFTEVMGLLKMSRTKRVVDKLATDSGEVEDEKLQKLNSLINSSSYSEVIFCFEKLRYSVVISVIQKLPGKVRIRFHAKGTGSIIGSDSKEDTGIIIAG
jgi:hypothetical protein